MIEELHPQPGPATVRTAEGSAMQRALDLAATGAFHRRGGNPRVGCVILDATGAVVGQGHHRGAGTPHAEVAALAVAGPAARGGTAVVTLEPCAHQGRTGPCADALIEAGIARVIFAQPDPNPLAAGGAARLRAAGVTVIGNVGADRAIMINSDWTFAQQHRRPWVRLKIASTLDGRVAAADGSSQWITSTAARADGHLLRARSDAVLAGTGTVLADNPRLTARTVPDSADQQPDQPLRVVFGTTEIPADAAVLDDSAETALLRTRSAPVALRTLRERGVSSVLIEGGPGVAATFLEAGLVDELISYIAPVLLGAGPAAVGDLGIWRIDDALRGEITDITSIGTGTERCARITTRLRTAAPTPDPQHPHSPHHEGDH
ncbi:bifunctional diaminohydroxyphosphoribosylaminopyrimidine deaminase/5-amino-6-(5-phosphoribosylamino)uracil reductase RibD [Microlunatus soli]